MRRVTESRKPAFDFVAQSGGADEQPRVDGDVLLVVTAERLHYGPFRSAVFEGFAGGVA